MPELSEIEPIILAAASIENPDHESLSFDERVVLQATLQQSAYATQLYTIAEFAKLFNNFTLYSESLYLHVRWLLFVQLTSLAEDLNLSPATIKSKQQELTDLIVQDPEQPEDIRDRAYSALYISAEILLLDLLLKYYNGLIDNTLFISTICDLKLIFKPTHPLLTQGDLNAVVKAAINQRQEWILECIFNSGIKSHMTSEMQAIIADLNNYSQQLADIGDEHQSARYLRISAVLNSNIMQDPVQEKSPSYDTSVAITSKTDILRRVKSAPAILSSTQPDKQVNYNELLTCTKDLDSSSFTRLQANFDHNQILSCLKSLFDFPKQIVNGKNGHNNSKAFKQACDRAFEQHKDNIIKFLDSITIPWHVMCELCIALSGTKEKQILLKLVSITANKFQVKSENAIDLNSLTKFSSLLEEALTSDKTLKNQNRTHPIFDIAAASIHLEATTLLDKDQADEELAANVINHFNTLLKTKYCCHVYKAMFQVTTPDRGTAFSIVLNNHKHNKRLLSFFAQKWIDFIVYVETNALNPYEYAYINDQGPMFSPRMSTTEDLILAAELAILRDYTSLDEMVEHTFFTQFCKNIPLFYYSKWRTLIEEARREPGRKLTHGQLRIVTCLSTIASKLKLNVDLVIVEAGNYRALIGDALSSRNQSLFYAVLCNFKFIIHPTILFYALENDWVTIEILTKILEQYKKNKPETDFSECTNTVGEVKYDLLMFCLFIARDIDKLAVLISAGIDIGYKYSSLKSAVIDTYNTPQILVYLNACVHKLSHEQQQLELYKILTAYKAAELRFSTDPAYSTVRVYGDIAAIKSEDGTIEHLNLAELIISLLCSNDATASQRAEFEAHIEKLLDLVLECDKSKYSIAAIQFAHVNPRPNSCDGSSATAESDAYIRYSKVLHIAVATGKLKIAQKLVTLLDAYPSYMENITKITYQRKTLKELAQDKGLDLSSLSPKFSPQQESYSSPKQRRP